MHHRLRVESGFGPTLGWMMVMALLWGIGLMGPRNAAAQATQPAPQATNAPDVYRLYDALTVLLDNQSGADFTITLDVRDINHNARGPAELLVKIYTPDGTAAHRRIVPDDGVVANTFGAPNSGYDHESWYYASTYSRGIEPAARFSAWTDPARVAAMPRRTFTFPVKAGGAGVYRMVLAGQPDHLITFATDVPMKYGVNGSPDFILGHHQRFRKSFIYIPRGTMGISIGAIEFDRPFGRAVTVKDEEGNVLLARDGTIGYIPGTLRFDDANKFDDPQKYWDRVLTVEVSDGPGAGDYLLSVQCLTPQGGRKVKGPNKSPGGHVFATLCPDAETARAIKSGVIYHGERVYFQPYQVRMHDWLDSLKPDDFVVPAGLAKNPAPFLSTGSHQEPATDAADRLLHDYVVSKDPHLLHAILRDMHEGMAIIGPDDHVIRGANLAYEMGAYSFFYHRAAWRILQQSDAPKNVKDLVREFVIQTGDRLAFCRGVELINGNALASLTQNLRYCVAASEDPIQKELFETYWTRFTTGGFGARIGLGPSGQVQEGFGYDQAYGSYLIAGYRAGIADLGEKRFADVAASTAQLCAYTYTPEVFGGAWSSRTSAPPVPRSWQSGDDPKYKGYGAGSEPDFTESVNGGNEFFAARRAAYYAVTYSGRITPSWLCEGTQGQIGFGGGMLCQLYVPGKGVVVASRLHGSYGEGMHVSKWRSFEINTIAGTTDDGMPFVGGNSDHGYGTLVDTTVTSSGEIRMSSLRSKRTTTFGDKFVDCAVELELSFGDRIYKLWGSGPALRGKVREAYELIPTMGFKSLGGKKAGETAFPLVALDAEGKSLGEVSSDQTKMITASAVVLDRGGYGVKVVLDQPRPVLRGSRGTLMVQLCNQSTPAEKVAIKYRLIPFVGSAENAGQ